jgi:hypothetical protein
MDFLKVFQDAQPELEQWRQRQVCNPPEELERGNELAGLRRGSDRRHRQRLHAVMSSAWPARACPASLPTVGNCARDFVALLDRWLVDDTDLRATPICPTALSVGARALGGAPGLAAPDGSPTVEYARCAVGGHVPIGMAREGVKDFAGERGLR